MLDNYKVKSTNFVVRGNSLYIDTNITNKNPGMLLIWAEWCGHCQRFKPTFSKLQKKLGSSFPMLSLEDNDLTDNNIKSSLDFRGFPTIKFFDQHGKIMGDYTSDRNESSILKHVCEVYHHCISYH
jgi:thiol-disulfide isomerase/thioredoxin